jgi:hypothetical protein
MSMKLRYSSLGASALADTICRRERTVATDGVATMLQRTAAVLQL